MDGEFSLDLSDNVVELSCIGVDTTWIIPTFEDIKQCSDEEIRNIASFITLINTAMEPENFLYFAERMLPDRFKIENEGSQAVNKRF